MRIFIPWDAAQHPETVIRDLHYAGLPAQAHTLVLSLAPAAVRIPAKAFVASNSGNDYDTITDGHISSEAYQAKIALGRHFPGWFIEYDRIAVNVSESRDTIIERARSWNADLIVIGSERHHRPFLPVVAEVADQSPCSVRIVHPRHQHPDAPLQALLYVDGSSDSLRMVEAFALRSFPRNTRVHLMSVIDEREWNLDRIHHMLDYFASHLRQNFPNIESQIRYGDPVDQILHYAIQQDIDSIFIAASATPCSKQIPNHVTRAAETTVEIVR